MHMRVLHTRGHIGRFCIEDTCMQGAHKVHESRVHTRHVWTSLIGEQEGA